MAAIQREVTRRVLIAESSQRTDYEAVTEQVRPRRALSAYHLGQETRQGGEGCIARASRSFHSLAQSRFQGDRAFISSRTSAASTAAPGSREKFVANSIAFRSALSACVRSRCARARSHLLGSFVLVSEVAGHLVQLQIGRRRVQSEGSRGLARVLGDQHCVVRVGRLASASHVSSRAATSAFDGCPSDVADALFSSST
jgi:hypothetical protein